ncbi:hypothetical protein LEP1GSC203_1582 [Leptospira terpstrae serovar Hualin str. LT 11-33 = ATCC 700639]|uniref:DNA-binding helix-turn-helix protein n=1 Tax=Leptospira terpstrae serovar Hualin str. LT 11-33 = ATCC 700639 TaxID=1257025 RepID=N1W1T6_9LEPT|nr:hypothetical protein [Leptospira terpstrae]EMY61646.1 hypothetical protein LEP1GSC203_1582 [Leptospira terpstrae serovar Hualin str. LT 11-33 = ATCC 700639]
MAWKETNVFEERMKFVVAWKRGGWSLTDLCHEFNISRVTGYNVCIGNLHIEGHRIFLSSALADEEVGLEEISDRHVKIHFYGVSLGVIDLYTGKLLHFKNPMQSSLPSESGF